jgi:hypothetical protein
LWTCDDAMQEKEPQEEKAEETVQVKGGGLFGFFQQDTIYADEPEEAVPPATEIVERAVTKRGTGRKSVKELVARKSTVRCAQCKKACDCM